MNIVSIPDYPQGSCFHFSQQNVIGQNFCNPFRQPRNITNIAKISVTSFFNQINFATIRDSRDDGKPMRHRFRYRQSTEMRQYKQVGSKKEIRNAINLLAGEHHPIHTGLRNMALNIQPRWSIANYEQSNIR